MKIHSSQSPVYEVLEQLGKTGIVPLCNTKTSIEKYVEDKLSDYLSEHIILSYTNHPKEGYYYFLYDIEKYSYEEAKDLISKLE